MDIIQTKGKTFTGQIAAFLTTLRDDFFKSHISLEVALMITNSISDIETEEAANQIAFFNSLGDLSHRKTMIYDPIAS